MPSSLSFQSVRQKIKNKASELTDIFLTHGGGKYAEEYKAVYDSKAFDDNQCLAISRLVDVYIALKRGLYTREQAIDKQRAILRDAFPT